LLESAIRNDYDSIIITELSLEKPGPKIVYVNDGFTRMTGYTKQEVLGKTPRILQGAKTDRAILERLKRRLIEGQAFFGHTINYRKDGSEFINQWDIHPLMNAQGEVTHWVSYQRDVTEKKESAKAIFNTDFGSLLKQREEFILKFSKDESGFICKYINEAFEEVTGYGSDDVFEKGLESVIHPDDIAMIELALSSAFEGKTVSELFRYKVPGSDQYQTIYQSFSPVKDDTSNKISTVKSVGKLELKEI
jgi:PAS domain S-box-containing protein